MRISDWRSNVCSDDLYALVPTLGTALVIIFGTSQTAVGRLLGHRVLVGIGLVSYSAYLWHQPLFAFARHRSPTEPSNWLYLGLSIFAIALAYLSWRDRKRLVEGKGVEGR